MNRKSFEAIEQGVKHSTDTLLFNNYPFLQNDAQELSTVLLFGASLGFTSPSSLFPGERAPRCGRNVCGEQQKYGMQRRESIIQNLLCHFTHFFVVELWKIRVFWSLFFQAHKLIILFHFALPKRVNSIRERYSMETERDSHPSSASYLNTYPAKLIMSLDVLES